MAKTFVYSFEDVTMTFSHPYYGTYSAYGAGLGTFSIAFSGEVTGHQISADLSVVISRHVVKNGTLTLSILQSSDFNKWLKGWSNYLEQVDPSRFALTDITITSKSTGETYHLTGCTHQKIADQEFGPDATNRSWTIMAADISVQ